MCALCAPSPSLHNIPNPTHQHHFMRAHACLRALTTKRSSSLLFLHNASVFLMHTPYCLCAFTHARPCRCAIPMRAFQGMGPRDPRPRGRRAHPRATRRLARAHRIGRATHPQRAHHPTARASLRNGAIPRTDRARAAHPSGESARSQAWGVMTPNKQLQGARLVTRRPTVTVLLMGSPAQ